jgi:hypothetical protein
MLFSEFCKQNNISQNGYHLKVLAKLDDDHKVDVTPRGNRATYAVYVPEADKVFGTDTDLVY